MYFFFFLWVTSCLEVTVCLPSCTNKTLQLYVQRDEEIYAVVSVVFKAWFCVFDSAPPLSKP